MAENNLPKPHFQDADKAREYLEALRWPNGPVCPHCGVVGGHYALTGKSTRPGLWKCKDCREQFTVTVGTVFERSKIALNVWLTAVYLLCSSKKGMSSHQLHRVLGVTYKTAWFMTHRIREAMKDGSPGILGGGGTPVEVDETYWGNKKRQRGTRQQNRSYHDAMKIVSLVERGGKARSFQFQTVYGGVLRDTLRRHIHPNATVHTDESGLYRPLWRYFEHQTINHAKGEYSRDGVTTNNVEGYFSILKRGLVGTFHHVGEQHLHRYCVEFDFRYNTRAALGYTDSERTAAALKQIGGKRLTYRRTSGEVAQA
jgi:transposase-like protein